MNRRLYRCILSAAMVLLLASAGSAVAQSEIDRFGSVLEQIERESRLMIDPDVPIDQRTLIDFGAYTSFFLGAIDDALGETHILRLTDLNAYLRVNVDNVHQGFVRARASYFDWNEGDDFDGEGDQWRGPEIERAVYRFNLKNAIAAYDGENVNYNVIFEGGRQLVHWGNGLTFSRVIDGASLVGELGDWRLEAVGGRTFTEQLDFDSSRPGFEDDLERLFYGAMLSYDLDGHTPYVYGLVQEDDDDDSISIPRTRFGYDSYYIGGGVRGPIGDHWLYGLEAVYEGGEGLSDPFRGPQRKEDIEAWALDARIDYMIGDDHNTRITGEALFASADDDRGSDTSNTLGGNRPGTDDEAFNGFGLINTGLAFNPEVSNLIMLRGGVSMFPAPSIGLLERLQVGVDAFGYFAMDEDAPIHEATDGHSYLGFETDLYANWQITSDLAVLARYGVFFPGSGLSRSDNNPQHFFFSGVTVAY